MMALLFLNDHGDHMLHRWLKSNARDFESHDYREWINHAEALALMHLTVGYGMMLRLLPHESNSGKVEQLMMERDWFDVPNKGQRSS